MKKILAVDDSELLHRMYDLVLMRYTRAGGKVLHARNGRQALDVLSEHADVDLILLDINMPVMSGLEFLTTMKAEAAFVEIPVIIVSTEGKQEDTILGLKKGARAYLTKPFQPNDLHALIDRIKQPATAAGQTSSVSQEKG